MKQPLTITSICLLALLSISLIGCASPSAPEPAAEVEAAATATIAPVQEESTEPWQIVLEMQVEQPVRMAAFLDESFGLTGGADRAGQAYFTTDGGQTWAMSESSSG
jgi:hypothetical protein